MAERLENCLGGDLGEIAWPVQMRATRGGTKRPHGALLHPGTGLGCVMCSIGGRLRTFSVRRAGAVSEIPPFSYSGSHPGTTPGDTVRRAV